MLIKIRYLDNIMGVISFVWTWSIINEFEKPPILFLVKWAYEGPVRLLKVADAFILLL